MKERTHSDIQLSFGFWKRFTERSLEIKFYMKLLSPYICPNLTSTQNKPYILPCFIGASVLSGCIHGGDFGDGRHQRTQYAVAAVRRRQGLGQALHAWLRDDSEQPHAHLALRGHLLVNNDKFYYNFIFIFYRVHEFDNQRFPCIDLRIS